MYFDLVGPSNSSASYMVSWIFRLFVQMHPNTDASLLNFDDDIWSCGPPCRRDVKISLTPIALNVLLRVITWGLNVFKLDLMCVKQSMCVL